MKNFFGKILNIVGISGLVIVYSFTIVTFVVGLIVGNSFIGNFMYFKENPGQIEFLLPVVLYLVGILFMIALVITDIMFLIPNRSTKLMTILSLIFLIYVCVDFGVTFYYVGLINSSHEGAINMIYFYVCGGIAILSSLSIVIGNLLNIKQVNSI